MWRPKCQWLAAFELKVPTAVTREGWSKHPPALPTDGEGALWGDPGNITWRKSKNTTTPQTLQTALLCPELPRTTLHVNLPLTVLQGLLQWRRVSEEISQLPYPQTPRVFTGIIGDLQISSGFSQPGLFVRDHSGAQNKPLYTWRQRMLCETLCLSKTMQHPSYLACHFA